MNIETAAEAQLNATIIGRRLKRSDERNASIAPTTTAAASSVKKQDQKYECVRN